MRSRIAYSFAGLLALLFLLSPGRVQAQSVEVRGWIMGLPMGKKATVVFEGPVKVRARCNAGGRYSTKLRPGTYTAIPHAPGLSFSPAQRRVQARSGVVDAINFRVQQAAAPSAAGQKGAKPLGIRGWVRGLAGGDSVEVTAEGPTPRSVMTKPGGHFHLADLQPGRYRLRFVSDKYKVSPQPKMVKLRKRDRKGLRFKARKRRKPAPLLSNKGKSARKFRVRGYLSDMRISGRCLQATVQARGAGPGINVSATTSKTGSMSCGHWELNLPEGKYTFTVSPMNRRVQKSFLPAKQVIVIEKDLEGVDFKATYWRR